jgi:uncharacterized protein YggE
VLIAVAGLIPIGVGAQEPQEKDEHFIHVTGTASVNVEPDRADLRFAVWSEAGTVEEAGGVNAATMEAVIDALRDQGGDGLELETLNFSVTPIYSRPERGDTLPPRIVAFRVENTLQVTADDLDRITDLIGAGMAAGANRISGLSFYADDTSAHEDRAYQLAVRDARRVATTVAKALGVKLGPPVEVRPTLQGRRRAEVAMDQGMGLAMRAEAAGPPIEAGSTSITANVMIRYRIGG